MVLRMRRDLASPWLATPRPARGRQLLDMKPDWKVVFPFELPRQ